MGRRVLSRAALLAAVAVALSAASAYGTLGVYFYRGASSPFSGTRFDGELYAATKRVFFLGFRDASNNTDGSIWYYDVSSKTYTFTGVTMPTPISNYGIAALTDPTGLGFYTFGGRDGNGNIITTVQVYYPATNTTAVDSSDPWPGTTPSHCVSLPAMGVAVVGNKAIVLGGASFSANGCVDDNSKQTWIFDPMAPAGSRWTQGPDLNVARGYITPAVVGNTVYAIGGDVNNGGVLSAQSTVESSVGGTSPWNDAGVADLPEPCDESQAFGWTTGPFANTVILAGCGQWPNALSDVLQYNIGSNSWAIVAHLNDARRNQAGTWLGAAGRSSMFVLGGYNSNGGSVLQSSEIGPGTAVGDAQQQGPQRPPSGGAIPNN